MQILMLPYIHSLKDYFRAYNFTKIKNGTIEY